MLGFRSQGASMLLALCSLLVFAAPATTAAPLFPSTYVAPATGPVLIRNATILTGTGARLDNADLLLVDGKISAVGQALPAVPNATVIDAKGRWVTPGII